MEGDFMLKGTKMGKFYAKLAEIQRNLKSPKNNLNKFGGYKYRSCSDILVAVKPLLDGLSLKLSDEVALIGDKIFVKATSMLTDGVNIWETHGWACVDLDRKGMDASQMTGAASSYARKYALSGLFDLDDTDDADTDIYTEKTRELAVNPIKPNGNGIGFERPKPSKASNKIGVAAQTNVVKKIYTGETMRFNTLPKEQENYFDPAEYM